MTTCKGSAMSLILLLCLSACKKEEPGTTTIRFLTYGKEEPVIHTAISAWETACTPLGECRYLDKGKYLTDDNGSLTLPGQKFMTYAPVNAEYWNPYPMLNPDWTHVPASNLGLTCYFFQPATVSLLFRSTGRGHHPYEADLRLSARTPPIDFVGNVPYLDRSFLVTRDTLLTFPVIGDLENNLNLFLSDPAGSTEVYQLILKPPANTNAYLTIQW
jgi:hypothetical protein